MDSYLIGAHQSIAGGIYKAIEKAYFLKTNTLQIFTKNSNRWIGKKISSKDLNKFFELREKYKIKSVIAHSAYLINLASDKQETVEKSVSALIEEMENCKILDIAYLVIHPGSHKGTGVDAGIERISKSLNIVLRRYLDCNIMILLETTAGQGNSVGHRLEHLRKIKEQVNYGDKIGYCLDTCHLFAAGYDFRDKESYLMLRENLKKILGFENIKVLHFNDSKKDIGSKVDRHEHIGKGKIGIDGFRFFLNDDFFKKLPIIIETPKENNMDEKNLNLLKNLIA